MTKKALIIFLVLGLSIAFCFQVLAMEVVKGKVLALDKEGKKISIGDKEYKLSDETLSIEIAVGDEVEAKVEDGVVKTVTKL